MSGASAGAGDRHPDDHEPAPRHLDRAPGSRYAPPGGPAAGPSRGGRTRALLAAGGVAGAGAVLWFALGEIELGPGLLAAAAAVGWAVALALAWGGNGAGFPRRGTRVTVAAGLAAGAIVVGFLANWAWARGEGGVLDPFAYLDQRWGLLAWVDIVVAALAAAIRAR